MRPHIIIPPPPPPTPCGCCSGSIGAFEEILDVVNVHDAQVIDESGKGLLAEYFFIDSNSQLLSPKWLTDSDGVFHWSVEGRDTSDLWINITAGPDYEALVLSPDELLSNPTVVLKSAKGSGNKWLVPAGIGVGLLILATSGSKKVSGFNPVQKFKGLSPGTKKVLLYAGGGLAAYFLIKYLLSAKPTPQQSQFLADAKKQLSYLATQYGIIPSKPISQYSAWAGKIVTAVDDCGTDESAIYSVFEDMQNEADVYELMIAYGVASYKGCFEGSYFGMVHRTLPETLTGDLSNSEIEHVNEILSDKGISFQF